MAAIRQQMCSVGVKRSGQQRVDIVYRRMAFRVAARDETMLCLPAAANPSTRRFGCAAGFNGVHESFPKKASIRWTEAN
jgi:hypothetical protein